MEPNRKTNELTGYALELVHHKARQLVGKAGFTQNDVADIEQEMIQDLSVRLLNFDPTRATYNTFVARLVEHKISNLLRHRQMEIRSYKREVCSLNENIDVGEGETIQRIDTISQDEHDIRTGKYRRSAQERVHLHLDVKMVLASLPPHLRKAAKMLQTKSVSRVARELGVPRRTFRDRHLAQLRELFTEKGLGDYLP